MKNRKKRISALLTVIALSVTMLSATGCSGGTSKESASDEGGAVGEESTQSIGKYDKVSDITFPLEEPVTLTAFVYAETTGGGTYADNYVIDYIKEKTNIDLDIQYDMDGDEGKTKLSLLMTDAESLPDIIISSGWSKTETTLYGQQGLIMPLNTYLPDCENWNKANEVSPMRLGDITMTDGNIYTYGVNNECYHCNYGYRMWIYKPWVDSLNDGKIPSTVDELYDFLKKVRDEDPNGNGIQDEIPISGFLTGWNADPTTWLTNSFIQCANTLGDTNPRFTSCMVLNNGKVEFQFNKDAYRDALRYMRKLYDEKLLDPQVFTQDETQFSATLDNEEHLVALHPGGMMLCDRTELWAGKDGPYQDWVAFEPVEGTNGVRLAGRSLNDYFGNGIGIVTKNCNNPALAVALFDFLSSDEAMMVQVYGPQGMGWEWTTEGTALDGGEPRYATLGVPEEIDWGSYGFDKSYTNYKWISGSCFENFNNEFRGDLQIDNPSTNIEAILQKAAESYAKYAPADDTMIPNITFSEDDAPKITDYALTIGGYVNQAAVQFITGSLDIEKDWDEYVKKLEDMGLADYVQVVQKSYDIYNENLK